ncbi:hypothetical protein [Roseibium album]|uniref:hypothetical protein n=1 Tax=Roseibium album TaxID=311410 RepID=UPI00391877A0
MPLDKNSPVGSEMGVYSPFDLKTPVGERSEEPGFFDAIPAAFRTENEVGSYLASEAMGLEKREYYRVDPEYNPFTNGDLEGYEEHSDRFLEAQNATVVEAIKADIDRETKDRETVAAAGWGGIFADITASVASPTVLLPGGALVRSGAAGYAGVRSAISVGAAAAAGAAVQETALHGTQQTRDVGESAYIVGGSLVLGGLLGAAGAQLFSRSDWAKFSRVLEDDLVDVTPHPSEVSQEIVRKLRSAGAASKDDIEKVDWEKELSIGGGRATQAIAKATAAVKLNPGLELMTSPSMRARSTFLRLAENHVGTAGEMEGRTLGPAAETAMKRYNGNLAKFIAKRREGFKSARKAGFKGNQKAFDEAVAKSTRRGDVDPDGNDFVTAVAQSWRKDVADPLKDEAVSVNLLPEGVKVTTAPSYLYRVYNQQKILQGEGKFRDILKRYIRSQVDRAVARQDEIEIAKQINKAVDVDEQLTRARGRLDSFEERLGKRDKVRAGKLSGIQRKEGQRFDLLRGRVPERVLEAAKQARDDDVMVRSVSQVAKAPKAAQARPVQALLKQMGGVKVGSYLDQELRNMGVTPQTSPGLFRKDGGLSAVDNLVAREHELLARFGTDQNGYADPGEILAAIRDEMAGAPLRLDDELAEEAARDALEANVADWLSQMGLPPNATAKQVRHHLENALSREGKLTDLDQAIGRMTGELEEFDRATDQILNEKLIAEAEAGKFLDELNELEAKINEVRELANASPTVKILVDHADARKAHGKARYDQTRLENRIEAIQRLEADGRLKPELEDELRALRSDKNAADERVIKAKAKVEKLKPMLPKDRGDELDFGDDSEVDVYVSSIVDDTFDRITGRQVQDGPSWLAPVTQGPLKGRTLHIPDEMIEEFLENDMEMIARKYVRQMGSEVELTRNFGRADLKEQLDEIKTEYKELRAAAKDQKEVQRLTNKETADVANLEAFRDMLRGTYRAGEERSAWSAMTRLALSWNYIRLLGGVLLSSFPDVANVATRQGLRSFMDDGLTGLVSGTKAAKIARQDAREWAGIAETVLQTRLAELAELHDPYAAGTAAERLMTNVTSTFSRLTMLDRWNDTLKTIVTLQTGNKVARLVNKSLTELPDKWGVVGRQSSFAKLDKGEVSYLGKLGVDEGMATRIADQIQKYGVQENGIWGLSLGAWDDTAARRVIGSALSKEADGGVVTPGIADKPLWARSNAGKLAMQFKSFALAAHQRVLLSRLQGNPKHLAEFLVFGTALGMMVSYLKFIERGDFEAANRLTENPGLWLADGFDRTGISTVLMDVSNTAEKVGLPFGVRTAAQAVAGDEDRGADVSRFASRNALGALFGPSVGTIQDLVTIASQAANRDVNSQGARAITRQIPFGTLPGARTAVQTTVKPALEGAAN